MVQIHMTTEPWEIESTDREPCQGPLQLTRIMLLIL